MNLFINTQEEHFSFVSSAIIIIIGSRLKIPLSTTHCQIGATIGVGLLENMRTMSGINGKLLLKTAVGWLITCVVVGGSTGLLVAQGVYGPTIEASHNLTNCSN